MAKTKAKTKAKTEVEAEEPKTKVKKVIDKYARAGLVRAVKKEK
tara:strand:+ start:181 stop:312 length:132 start_codon:yes stop_codon:yes gene_type:complete